MYVMKIVYSERFAVMRHIWSVVLHYRLTTLQESGMYEAFELHMAQSQHSDDSEYQTNDIDDLCNDL